MNEFIEHAKKIKKIIDAMESPLVIHHYDADGIASGSLVYKSLAEEGKDVEVKAIRTLTPGDVEEVKDREVIFVDLGSGVEDVNKIKDVVIIDHHQIQGVKKPMLNPRMFGISGEKEASSSTTAYAIFKKHVDLALVGATGDMQIPFVGWNREVLMEGIEKGVVKMEFDITLYGRTSRPLIQFLAYSDEPFIDGISFNEEGAKAFLESLNIKLKKEDRWLSYSDLGGEEKKRIISGLVEILIENNRGEEAKSLVGEVYSLLNRDKKTPLHDPREFATLLNATGRHGKPELGVKICLGEKDALKEGMKLLEKHRKMIREGISFAQTAISDEGSYLLIDGRNTIPDGIIGIICGMVMKPYYKKPIIGLSQTKKGTIKISSRGNKSLIEKGLNLGSVMKKAGSLTGGVGGGHKIAAGAEVEEEKLHMFLDIAGKIIKEQVG